MRITGEPVGLRARHGETGEEHDVLLAELVMDEPQDAGRTGGWYWRFREEGQVPGDPTAWREAVRAERGPHRNPNNAVASIGHWTEAGAELAARLGEAAELVRSGDLAPEAGAVSEWLLTAQEMDRAGRPGTGGQRPKDRDGRAVERGQEAADGGLAPDGPTG